MMVSDYPEAYKGQKDFEFIKEVPASWDETRVVNGKVGEFVTVARKKGSDWYLGGITNWDAREVSIPLEFLGSGEYIAEIYSDAPDADVNPKHTTIEQRRRHGRNLIESEPRSRRWRGSKIFAGEVGPPGFPSNPTRNIFTILWTFPVSSPTILVWPLPNARRNSWISSPVSWTKRDTVPAMRKSPTG